MRGEPVRLPPSLSEPPESPPRIPLTDRVDSNEEAAARGRALDTQCQTHADDTRILTRGRQTKTTILLEHAKSMRTPRTANHTTAYEEIPGPEIIGNVVWK